MLQITNKLQDDAPKGWEGMYSADVADDSLNELGSVYSSNFEEIIAWLKGNGFRLDDEESDVIINDRYEQAIIWYHGSPVGGRKLYRAWDKING
jgi:hypothetical protein